jgi:transcriptional regulator GlxA family with amidase domain
LALLGPGCGDGISIEVSGDANEEMYSVGILVMDGVYNTELTAPFDIFQHTKYREGIKPMRVFTVSASEEVVTTFEGMKVVADYTLLNTPQIDILVIPAAEGHLDKDLENRELLRWITGVSNKAEFVTSHCDGAFLLAAAGLPKGTNVTTFPGDIDELERRFEDIIVHRDVLFVHDGKWITGVGGARSFEAALYVCHLLYGEAIAKELSAGMVLDWELDSLEFLRIEP